MIRPRARDHSRSEGRDAVLEGVVNIQCYSDFDMIKELVMALNASKLPERSGSHGHKRSTSTSNPHKVPEFYDSTHYQPTTATPPFYRTRISNHLLLIIQSFTHSHNTPLSFEPSQTLRPFYLRFPALQPHFTQLGII